MKENFFVISLTYLCFHTCLSLASDVKLLAEAGKQVSLPCDVQTDGDIEWHMDKGLLIKYFRSKRFHGPRVKDQTRYSVPSHITNNLSLMKVGIDDSGIYTCQTGKSILRTVELLVFLVSIQPSASLFLSEDLVLELKSKPSLVPRLIVSWKKDGTVKSSDHKLEENNVQLNSAGSYVCHITLDSGHSLDITKWIKVFGFHDAPSIVYTTGNDPVTIPWTFSFNLRNKLMISDVHVEGGSIVHSYSSQMISNLSVVSGNVNWLANSDSKDVSEKTNDLNIHLLNPKAGKHYMEIVLKIGDRKKILSREVCVASLTVPDSKSDLSPHTRVPLQCSVTCIDSNSKLCWHQWKTGREMCGQEGHNSFPIEVTTGNETEVIWNCSVTSGNKRLVSAMVTLELKSSPELSSTLFWVLVGVGIFILLLIVLIITIVIARNRQVKRERYRAWLLENINQQRRCECKGFAPKRLTSDYV
ncbi:T-cell surface glycoprotein CD4-like [Dendropsophus ebraccatus]|uniref:T-cell surface glycoprotein CD4-like n=1 Tax=Dendropsophus ebraccatus TaxID=150705 RepID=UPI0038318A02